MIHPVFAAVVIGALIFLTIMVMVLWWEVLKLMRNSHPPIDLTPAVIGILKATGAICSRPPEGWWCSRPVGHHGPCAAYDIGEGAA